MYMYKYILYKYYGLAKNVCIRCVLFNVYEWIHFLQCEQKKFKWEVIPLHFTERVSLRHPLFNDILRTSQRPVWKS